MILKSYCKDTPWRVATGCFYVYRKSFAFAQIKTNSFADPQAYKNSFEWRNAVYCKFDNKLC